MKVEHHRERSALPAHLASDARLTELSRWGARLAGAGLSPGESGNLSCRVSTGFLITRTGVALASIETDDWVHVTDVVPDDTGAVVVASRGVYEPSMDSAVHAAIYADRLEATTIFHFHVGHLDVLTGRLQVPATTTYYPAGTTESMKAIQRFLGEHQGVDYFVLVDHGIVAVGSSIDATGDLVESYRRAVESKGVP